MEIPTIFVYTHDSIGLGEDGPTHQPIEQLAALRAMPGLMLLRPADANEVVEAWKVIMQLRHEPAALVLTRQALPTFDRSKYASASGVAKGAYILADAADGKPEVILMATGSEVSLCVNAYEQLKSEGIKARVVSMPSWDIFEKQSDEYKKQVLPPDVKARVSVEAAATLRLVAVCRPERQDDRHAPFRSLRADQGFAKEVRLHRGQGSRSGAGSNRAIEIITTQLAGVAGPRVKRRGDACMATGILETAKATNPLKDLQKFGQSVWLDYIRRDLLTSGELKRLIEEDGLRGMTSNPAIFEKAIAGQHDYADILKSLQSQS